MDEASTVGAFAQKFVVSVDRCNLAFAAVFATLEITVVNHRARGQGWFMGHLVLFISIYGLYPTRGRRVNPFSRQGTMGSMTG
jgi:hypothetical protein